jgi:hypothetical protein
MKEIVKDVNLVAYCGLYCGRLRPYLKGRCPAVTKNESRMVQIAVAALRNSYASCDDCTKHTDPLNCRNFNNFFSGNRIILNSDRSKCIAKKKQWASTASPDLDRPENSNSSRHERKNELGVSYSFAMLCCQNSESSRIRNRYFRNIP